MQGKQIMKIQQLIKVSALGMLMASAGSFAADGPKTTGSSAASSQVRGTIPQMIRITGLGDGSDQFSLGNYDPAVPADLVATDTFCVFRNKTSGTFAIELEGDGGTTATTDFKIDDGTNDLAYTVKYNDDSTGTLVAYATPGTTLTGQSANTNPVCASGITAGLEITVAQADADAAIAGTYTGNLTVTVTVE
jgi:hypothetical protein